MLPERVRIGSGDDRPDWADPAWYAEPVSGDMGRTEGRGATGLGTRGRWALAVMVVAAAAAGSAVAFERIVDPHAFADWLGPRASSIVNREVRVGEAGLALLPRPGIRLRNVDVGNLAGFEGRPLISVRRVDLGVALSALLRGTVVIDEVELTGVDVRLAVDERGVSNFGDFVPQAGSAASRPASPRARLAVREVSVTDASVSYFDVPRDRSLLAVGARASVSLGTAQEGRWGLRLEARPDSLHLRAGGRITRLGGPRVALALSGDDTLRTIELDEGHVDHAALALSVAGGLTGLRSGRPRVDLRIEDPAIEASRLAALLPAEDRERLLPAMEGTLRLALRVAGPLAEDGPSVTGSLSFDDVGVHLRGQRVAEGVTGTLGLGREGIRIDSVRGTAARGPFTVSGLLESSTRRATLSLSGSPDLAALRRLGPGPDEPDITGRAEVALRIEGSLDSLDTAEVSGDVVVEGLRTVHPRLAVPVYLPVAELSVEPGELRWRDVTVLLGEAPIVVTGRLRAHPMRLWLGEEIPDLDVSIRGRRLDLSALLPETAPPSGAAYPQIAFAHLAGVEIEGRAPGTAAARRGFTRPRELPARGTVGLSLDTVTYRGLELDEVSARISLTDTALVIEDGAFRLWRGSWQTGLHLGIGAVTEAPFEFVLRGETPDATAFLTTLTPFSDRVEGTLDIDLDVRGTTGRDLLPVPGSLGGSASLALQDGRVSETGLNYALADFLSAEEWRTLPFDLWTTELRFVEHHVEIERSALQGELGSVASTGEVELGGGLDLSMGISIPPGRLLSLSLRRTGIGPGVLERLSEDGHPLDLGIRIAGSLAGPSIEPDALAATDVLAHARRR